MVLQGTPMSTPRLFLAFSGLFIIAAGLFYAAPKPALENAFLISIDNNALHMLRASMGLYCGIGCLILLGSIKQQYTLQSLLLGAVFFGGIGIGRIVSFVIDENANSIALGATGLEVLLCIASLLMLVANRGQSNP